MRIITLNCFLSPWSQKRKTRLPYLAKALTTEKPDVILLQEVSFKSDAAYLIDNLKKQGFVDFFYSNTLLTASKYPLVSKTFKSFKTVLSDHYGMALNLH